MHGGTCSTGWQIAGNSIQLGVRRDKQPPATTVPPVTTGPEPLSSAHSSGDHGAGHSAHGVGGGVNAMAASATLHCLTGCSIGEIGGLIIGTAAGLSNLATVVVSIALAFVFGYTLSSLPLLKAGLAVGAVAGIVLASDTLSILIMEIVDNLTVLLIPGAMNAGLTNPTFWWSMMLALLIAYGAAYPLNRYLLQRGKGHAVTHRAYDNVPTDAPAWHTRIPAPPPGALGAAIATFMLGGLLVAAAAALTTH